MAHAQTEPAERTASAPLIARVLSAAHLDPINDVLASAISVWDVSSRVKRLVLSSYLYDQHDFSHLVFFGAWRDDELVGFVALEPTGEKCLSGEWASILIHGLYVAPGMHRVGIGTKLMEAAREFAQQKGCIELQVRAERNAQAFFEKIGFTPLPIEDTQRDYPHRLRASLDTLRSLHSINCQKAQQDAPIA